MTMDPEEVLDTFREAGALLDGHFVYASGRHGRQFLQAARVLQYPKLTERLCKAMAYHFAEHDVQLVVGPATGGIILAYETARHLKCRSAFTEKNDDGSMAMKRGFHLAAGTRVLVVEDIVTTGGSVLKAVEHLNERAAEVIGVACLIDRSGGNATFPCPFRALATLTLESWPADDCPLCAKNVEILEPDDLVL